MSIYTYLSSVSCMMVEQKKGKSRSSVPLLFCGYFSVKDFGQTVLLAGNFSRFACFLARLTFEHGNRTLLFSLRLCFFFCGLPLGFWRFFGGLLCGDCHLGSAVTISLGEARSCNLESLTSHSSLANETWFLESCSARAKEAHDLVECCRQNHWKGEYSKGGAGFSKSP